MKLQIDEQVYTIDLKTISSHLLTWYENNKHNADTIQLENGKTIDFSRKSITRIGFKTLMVPIIIPAVKMLYATKKIEAPKKDKHEDLLDYAAMSLLSFIGELDGNNAYVESVATDNSDSRRITTLSTVGPVRRTITGPTVSPEDTEVGTGGEARVLHREVGDGQDLRSEECNQQETTSSTLAERILH